MYHNTYFGAIVTAFALAFTEMNRGHIAVDVMVNRFPQNIQKFLYVLNSFICFVFFVIATWYIVKKATILLRTGEVTETLQIIYYPFTYAVALGFGVLSLVLLSNVIKTLFPAEEDPN